MYKPLNLDLLALAIESGVFRKFMDPQAAADAPLVIDMKMMHGANLVGKITDGVKLLASVCRIESVGFWVNFTDPAIYLLRLLLTRLGQGPSVCVCVCVCV